MTLAFCQDTQAEAFYYPASFFEPKVWRIRRPEPDSRDIADVVALIKGAKNPVLVCGGGVTYSQAEETLGELATRHGIPVIVIDTDPMHGPGENGGGHWWDVAEQTEVNKARE